MRPHRISSISGSFTGACVILAFFVTDGFGVAGLRYVAKPLPLPNFTILSLSHLLDFLYLSNFFWKSNAIVLPLTLFIVVMDFLSSTAFLTIAYFFSKKLFLVII
jgi:hypothetical protein